MLRGMLTVLLGVVVLAALPSQAVAGGRSGHHRGYGGHGSHYSGHGSHYRGNRSYYRGHRSHYGGHYSFWLGPLAWSSRWYPGYPYRYRREPTVIVEERTVYVERPATAEPAESWWYYCESAAAYYPDVDSCPERWVKVAPRPPIDVGESR